MNDELTAKLFSGKNALVLRNKLELAMECLREYFVILGPWERAGTSLAWIPLWRGWKMRQAPTGRSCLGYALPDSPLPDRMLVACYGFCLVLLLAWMRTSIPPGDGPAQRHNKASTKRRWAMNIDMRS
jgi:hypothetical protein